MDYAKPVILPGERVQVETSIIMKRKGMIECLQTASFERKRIAQRKTMVMIIDAETKKTVNHSPDWAMEKLGHWVGSDKCRKPRKK